MAGLQRSAISFRRQGSSGLVWDDKLIQEELNKDKDNPASEQEVSAGSASASADQKPELRRTRSDGGGRRNNYRTIKVDQTEDPPSPRVAGCGFCSVFGRPAAVKTNATKRKSGKAKHR